MTVSLIRQTRSMSNQTCHFDVAGLPNRIGTPLDIRMSPEFGLHCHKSTFGKCCCLPISQTWHMNCKEAKLFKKDRKCTSNPISTIFLQLTTLDFLIDAEA